MGGMTERARLLAAADDGPLDAHAATIRFVLGCDAAVITVLGDDEQRFLGMQGMKGPSRRLRGTGLDRSLCLHVARDVRPLRLDDTAGHADYRDHPALTHLGIEAYLGVPLRAPSGEVVGAVAGLSTTPRSWSRNDLTKLEHLRDLVEDELDRLLDSTVARAAHRELSLVLSTLRHELGGRLSIVLGGIETAMLPGIDDDLRLRVLGNARRDGRRVVDTLDALLRTDGRAPDQLVPVDLASLVADVAEEASAMHGSDRIRVVAPPTSLVTEPTLLAHVLRNLVDNACKYTDGVVTIRLVPGPDGATFAVADDGPGMPDDVIEQLYEPFSRARDDGGASGFGLGLYIVRTLCQRLGAEIDVDTGPGGTTVTVVVPERRQSPKPSNAASSSDGA